MDIDTTKQPETMQVPSQPPAQKHNSFFSWFGKIVLFLLIAGGLAFGGYYFGTHGTKKMTDSTTPTPQYTMQKDDQQPTNTPMPTAMQKKKVKAGMNSDATSFKPYSVELPEGWTDTREQSAITDKLILTKNGYSVSIYQAAIGGGGCLYKGDAEVMMAQKFTNFAAIAGKNADFRRSWNEDAAAKIAYTVCQKNTSDGSYGSPTTFGAVSATAPKPADDTILGELDSIVASLTKE